MENNAFYVTKNVFVFRDRQTTRIHLGEERTQMQEYSISCGMKMGRQHVKKSNVISAS